jgi:hypothetical protein
MQIFNAKFFVLWATQKSQNLIKFGDFKYTYSDPRVRHCCVAKNTKYLKLIFLHVSGINHWLHPDFFFNFFETRKCDYRFFLNNEIPGAQEPKISTLIVDKLTKVAHFRQVKKTSSLEMLARLYIKIVANCGIPNSIISARDWRFVSRF